MLHVNHDVSRTMPTTRRQTGMGRSAADLKTRCDNLNNTIKEIDEHLMNTECYYCMGSEGSLTSDNSVLHVCGHGHHDRCGMLARANNWQNLRERLGALHAIQSGSDVNLDDLQEASLSEVVWGLRCGLCRYKFVGDDSVTLCHTVSSYSMLNDDTNDANYRRLESVERHIAVTKGIVDGTYTREHLPPSTNDGCIIC